MQHNRMPLIEPVAPEAQLKAILSTFSEAEPQRPDTAKLVWGYSIGNVKEQLAFRAEAIEYNDFIHDMVDLDSLELAPAKSSYTVTVQVESVTKGQPLPLEAHEYELELFDF